MVTCCGPYATGDLRSKITIQRKTRVADGAGGATEAWADVATVWAKWEPLRGSEMWRAQRISPLVQIKAAIRFRGDANGAPYYSIADRVLYRGRYHSVVAAIDPDDRQQWIELMLTEGAPS